MNACLRSTVSMNRTDGQLAMSRAIGDYQYKCDPGLAQHEQKVIPTPDVTIETLEAGDQLLIMCDGIVEQMTNQVGRQEERARERERQRQRERERERQKEKTETTETEKTDTYTREGRQQHKANRHAQARTGTQAGRHAGRQSEEEGAGGPTSSAGNSSGGTVRPG